MYSIWIRKCPNISTTAYPRIFSTIFIVLTISLSFSIRRISIVKSFHLLGIFQTATNIEFFDPLRLTYALPRLTSKTSLSKVKHLLCKIGFEYKIYQPKAVVLCTIILYFAMSWIYLQGICHHLCRQFTTERLSSRKYSFLPV